MRQYQVYGLGNALVDIEVEVDQDELMILGVDKGVMTLVDEDRHDDLLSHVEGKRHNRACGGSAANTIIAVAQLGAKSFYSCRIGNDETGLFYLEDLKNEGVATNLNPEQLEAGTTGKCLVMITPDADRTMNTFLGITSELTENSLDEQALADSEYLYVEGYLASSEVATATAIKAIDFAKQNQVKVALSLSDPSMVEIFGGALTKMIGEGVDLLFCNHDEALAYTDAEDIEGAVTALKAVAKQFVITLGADGALAYDGEQQHMIKGHHVKAVDTNGAGDLFAGSMLYGITKGMDFKAAAELASFASSRLVTSFGPRLTASLLKEVKLKINN
jgi:sugar/nucleoside kinase (ribokinase family)